MDQSSNDMTKLGTTLDDAAPPTVPPPRRQFRFGLKALFIVMTLLCVWLGYKFARERRAAEMLSRRQAVYNTLIKNLSKPTADTHIKFAAELLRMALASRDERWILSSGTSRTYAEDHLELTLGPTISSMSGDKIVGEIADHVGRGLNQCGLYWNGGLTQSVGPAWRHVGSWQQDPVPEFTILIEVVAEPAQSKSALIWVAVVENQLLFSFGARETILVLLFLSIGCWLSFRHGLISA
jgi:hypothetical protein